MRVLVLDDMEPRHQFFRACFIGVDVTHAYTYEEAVAALGGDKFDWAFLDRDLTEKQTLGYVDREKTGEDVANVIAAMPLEKRPDHVVIHSLNSSGAARMGHTLQDAGIKEVTTMPFTILTRRIHLL
jgi:hypothetical protein